MKFVYKFQYLLIFIFSLFRLSITVLTHKPSLSMSLLLAFFDDVTN